jgi:hypothetical protein
MDRRHVWDETHMIIWAMIFDAIVGHALRQVFLPPSLLFGFLLWPCPFPRRPRSSVALTVDGRVCECYGRGLPQLGRTALI